MPIITEEKEIHLRRIIRDAKAVDPLMSLRSLQVIVEKKINRSIDLDYLSKLVKKVARENIMRVERGTVMTRMAEIKESYRTIKEELRRLAYPSLEPGQRVNETERRKCLEAIFRIEQIEAKLEMDFGIFDRHLGKVEVDHRVKPIPDTVLPNVIRAFGAWAPIGTQMRRIEPQRVEIPKTTHSPNESSNTSPEPKSERIEAVRDAGLVTVE